MTVLSLLALGVLSRHRTNELLSDANFTSLAIGLLAQGGDHHEEVTTLGPEHVWMVAPLADGVTMPVQHAWSPT